MSGARDSKVAFRPIDFQRRGTRCTVAVGREGGRGRGQSVGTDDRSASSSGSMTRPTSEPHRRRALLDRMTNDGRHRMTDRTVKSDRVAPLFSRLLLHFMVTRDARRSLAETRTAGRCVALPRVRPRCAYLLHFTSPSWASPDETMSDSGFTTGSSQRTVNSARPASTKLFLPLDGQLACPDHGGRPVHLVVSTTREEVPSSLIAGFRGSRRRLAFLLDG